MKIGFLGDVFSVYEKAGIYHYAKGMLHGLNQNTSNILLVTASSDISVKSGNIYTADYYRANRIKSMDFLHNLLFFPRNIKLTKDLNKLVDVVYCPQCRITDLPYFFGLKVPMLTTLHDIHALIVKASLPYKVRFMLRYAVPKLLAKKKNVFLAVPTKFVMEQLTEYLHIPPKKIRVIPAAIESPTWIKKISKTQAEDIVEQEVGIREYIFYLGRQAQIETLLSIIAILKKKYNLSVETVIAGLGINRQATMSKIHDLGLAENVKFLGPISEQRKWLLLKAAKVYVFPERAGGFGIPPVEAMTVSTPVVYYNANPLREVIANGGLTGSSDEEIADLVYACYSDEQLRKKTAQKGFERAKLFHPINVASHLLSCLDKIVLESK